MIGDNFIIDAVVHVSGSGLSRDRLNDRPDSEAARRWFLSGVSSSPGLVGRVSNRKELYSLDEAYRIMFVDSPVDMAMACVVPIFDWVKEWEGGITGNHAFAQEHADRVLFCGGVDPSYRGLNYALEQIEYQVRELGASSIKFYNAHVSAPSWSCDDERIAYPMYEKCKELGVKVLQFHKSEAIAFVNVEDFRPNDVQAPARDFRDLTFLLHHVSRTYFEELVSIASRFENIHILLSPLFSVGLIAPRLMQEQLGYLLQVVGADRLVYGSEGPVNGPSGGMIQQFLAMEIPEDLRHGYGYPQITSADKQQILGLNFARLFGIDVEAKKRELGLRDFEEANR